MTRPLARIALLAAAVLATGVGVLVVHASASSPSAPSATTLFGVTPLEVTAFSGPLRCPPHGRSGVTATVPPADTLPAGAVFARLCPVLGRGHRDWSAPLDMVVSGADALAAVYDALPAGQALPCAATPGPTTAFSIAFMYTGGSIVRIEADSTADGDCSLIGIDGGHGLGRADAGTMLTSYLHALAVQRGAWQPPAGSWPLPTSCADSRGFTAGIVPSGTSLGLAQVTVCVQQSFPDEPGHFGVLTPAQVSEVNASYLANHSVRVPAGVLCMNPDPPADVIVGRTAWGDLVVLRSACYDFARQVGADHRTTYWQPTSKDQAMLHQAAGA